MGAELQCATTHGQFMSNIFPHDYGSIQVCCASSVKIMRVPQTISQLFAILHNRILEVIYEPRDRALSVHIAARLRFASIYTDKALPLGL